MNRAYDPTVPAEDAKGYTFRKPRYTYASFGIPYTAVLAQAFRWNVLGIAPLGPLPPSLVSAKPRFPTLPVCRSREGCKQILDSVRVPSFFPKRCS